MKMPAVDLVAIPEIIKRDYIQEPPRYLYTTAIDLARKQDFCEDLRNKSKPLASSLSHDCPSPAKAVNEIHLRGRPVSWSDLPSPAVEKIYSFLCRQDQYRMSLVCRRWSKEYKSPAVWRSVKFYLKKSKSSERLYPEVVFARRYGHLFRHVQIIYCESNGSKSLKCMKEQLKLFLRAITCRSRLLSISFINKSYHSVFRFFNTSSVFQSIVKCLSSQTTLRSIEFDDSYVTKQEITHILKTAFLSNPENLKELKIKVFNCYSALDRSCRDDQDLDLPFIHSFLNLEVFEADYTRFFELLIAEPLRRAHEIESELWKKAKLKRIKLLCDRNVANQFCFECLGISNTAWKYLKKICPEVSVDLRLVTVFSYQDIVPFLIVPGMPLRSLEVEMKQCFGENIELLLKNLVKSGSNDYLEEISISSSQKFAIDASDLEEFLQACSKLKLVKFKVSYPVFELFDALDCLLQNAPKTLEAVSIIVAYFDDEIYVPFYQTMACHYKSLFQTSNIQLSVSDRFHTAII